MRTAEKGRRIALAGQPNVGKSSIFNALTGMHQHTGNWSGKTVALATGVCRIGEETVTLADIPGTYSLMARSEEEAVARDFLLFGDADAVVVVCDATAPERGLSLALQTMEVCERVILCVNLMDEAERQQVHLDLSAMANLLGIPVVGVSARRKKSLEALKKVMAEPIPTAPLPVRYGEEMEEAVAVVAAAVAKACPTEKDRLVRYAALSALLGEESLLLRLGTMTDAAVLTALARGREMLSASEMSGAAAVTHVVARVTARADEIAAAAVRRSAASTGQKMDRLLTGRVTAFPVMLLLLFFVFWLTVSGANLPSAWLSKLLFCLEAPLYDLLLWLRLPTAPAELLVFGGYRVLALVVSVMLPPMAIFFPLFTLMEDAGCLPRIAYNLDRPFKACRACGKQALTMCMGFGCNAAGVVGCRIVDSPRERLLAILTNSFVPCNGRFPTMILLISLFFVGTGGLLGSLSAAFWLLFWVTVGVAGTFLATRLLSATILSGVPSSFTLELPPFRRPQVGRVIVRSVLDRTLKVLGRAAAVALPAGLLLWLLADIRVGGQTLLGYGAAALDPIGRLMGLDGVMLLAFVLGFPANEIVLPVALMIYTSGHVLTEVGDVGQVGAILAANGWTWQTAVSATLFSLFHWPCSTTLWTVRKETGSAWYTLAAALLPTAFGFLFCVVFTAIAA